MGWAAGAGGLRGLDAGEALQGGQHQRLLHVGPPLRHHQQLHRQGRRAPAELHIPGHRVFINTMKHKEFPGEYFYTVLSL